MNYWARRAALHYHRYATSYVRKYCPTPGTLLDVGGGTQYGAQYLRNLPDWDRTSVELPSTQLGFCEGVRVIKGDFLDWQPDRTYDVVTCLQVLEHVADPPAFAAKLFACARNLVVISVPFKWRKGAEKSHIHDPIDRDKLAQWVGRERTESKVVDLPPFRRLVSAYLLPRATDAQPATVPT